MDKIRVNLEQNGYDVIVGRNIIPQIGTLIAEVGVFSKVAVISDINVGPIYLDSVKDSLTKKGFPVCSIEISDGEATKGLDHAELLV